MKYSVVIVGAGQLGSRYLQGLVNSSHTLDIFIVDPNKAALNTSKERWEESGGSLSKHSLTQSEDIFKTPKSIDLVICATTANARLSVVKNLTGHARVKYWILEKVLAQSVSDVNHIVNQIKSQSSTAWVNTPRRAMDWYKNIKTKLSKSSFELSIIGGGWGMACNSIHFMDLFSWWSNDKIIKLDVTGLEPEWFESKRNGFWEVSGVIKVYTSKGSSMLLRCDREKRETTIKLLQENTEWVIDETLCCATRNDGYKINGEVPMQSELTAELVNSIINDGVCSLPSLNESAAMHSLLLEALNEHWQNHSSISSSSAKIT